MIAALVLAIDTSAIVDSLTVEAAEALKVKVSRKRVRVSIEERPYYYIVNLYLPPPGGGFNESHLRRFQNYLIKEHRMFAKPITIGKFTYLKFSGLWHDHILQEGSARIMRDSLYIRFYLARTLDRFIPAENFVKLVREVAGSKVVAIGLDNVELRKAGAFTVVSMRHPLVIRKDVSVQEFRDSLLSTINSISDRFDPEDSAFVNVNLKGKIYRKLWIELGIDGEESIYRYGGIDIRVVE